MRVFEKKGRGFTLIELLVVVLIIGVLAAMGLTQYTKTMEAARADDALATAKSIANANRMYALDHGGAYLTGNMSGCAPDGASTTCTAGGGTACDLLYCGYLARQELRPPVKSYLFEAADTAAAGTYAARSVRNGGDAPYNTWGFRVTKTGTASILGTDQPAAQ